MITGIASCPNPPLLLPGLTGQPVAEVELLRAACLAAITDLLNSGPDQLVVLGAGTESDRLSVTVGQSLLAQAGCELPVYVEVIDPAASTEDCLRLGRRLAAGPDQYGLLVLADGSARRSVKAPGYLDDRAAPFDAVVERSLRNGEPSGLIGLDPGLAAELLVAGRAAWQVQAGAAEGRRWSPQLYYSDDPFGVWYPVAGWLPV